MAKVSCAVCRFGLTTWTVKVNVPSWVGVPIRIAPWVPLLASEMPGGRLPATTVKVSVVPSLVASQKVPCRERMADAMRVDAWPAEGAQNWPFCPGVTPVTGHP